MSAPHSRFRPPSAAMRSWLILPGLAIAYAPMAANPLLRALGADFISGPSSVLLWNWLAVALLGVFVLAVERRGPASIGLVRPTGGDVAWALAFFVISTLASWVIHAAFPPPPSEGMATLLALPVPVLVALILTTATTEEILYRGYPVERLRELTGRTWLGVVISFVLFVAPHLAFFGPQWLVYQGVSVVLLYVLYLWRRNLVACMIMHLAGNAPILIPALGLAGG